MNVSHLSLINFRNYSNLDIDLPPGVCLLQGGNAQGKTNLLEAIYILATTKSARATSEGELINWQAAYHSPPVARIFAQVHRAKGDLQVEIAFRGQPAEKAYSRSSRGQIFLNGEGQTTAIIDQTPGVQKRVKINGIVRRAVDLVGQVKVVMFEPEDIDIISGSPSLRRRYLDIVNCQLDSRYLRALQRYHRVLTQRNHLLRNLRERPSNADELAFWDQQLVELGSYLIAERRRTVSAIGDRAQPIHLKLTGGKEELTLAYYPSVGQHLENISDESDWLQKVAEDFKRALAKVQNREIMQGVTLIGPHRDDLHFLVNGVDMGPYGSRGQQRTITLSLRLAEANLFYDRAGEHPIILLDDVLSELDEERRQHLLDFIADHHQVIVTASDFDRFEPWFLARATQFRVREGKIEQIVG